MSDLISSFCEVDEESGGKLASLPSRRWVGGSEPGLGGKDNMWVWNILMGRTTRNRRMTRLSTMMVTRMARMRMIMVDRDTDMWV